MNDDFLKKRGQSLEESFFHRRNAELMEDLRRQTRLEAKRNEFAMVSGIRDPKLLDRLIDMDLSTGTVAALVLIPMARVAWADGKLEDRERDAILKAAVDSGLTKDGPGYQWLVMWLEQPPDAELAAAWHGYISALLETLSADDREALRRCLIERTKYVAEAAGGFLGLGNKISDAEQAVLDELQAAFTQ